MKHSRTFSSWILPAMALFLAGSPATMGAASFPSAVVQKKAGARFRTSVDQVVVYVSVYDRSNHLVDGLKAEDFQLYENKVEQQISSFGRVDVPSTLGIVIDRSGSMRDKFEMVSEAAQLFLSMNNPRDEMFLVSFKDKAQLEQDFTRDVEDIKDALENIIISGGTALYDAIYLAVDQARQGHEPRKTVVVFTDGEDRDSYYSQEELLDKVRESDVQVYIVAFLDPELSKKKGIFGIFRSQREKVRKKLTEIAEETGGKAFFPEKIDQLKGVFTQIAHELRSQYRLAYLSSNPAQDGTWRAIRVVVRDAHRRGFKVRAKKGYLARKEAPSGN